MPGYQEIGPASTPLLYLENQNQLMQQQAADWERNLQGQGLDDETYAGEIQKKQAEVDDFMAEFQAKTQMMQQSQKFVDLGFISPEESQEAMWAQVLPRELHEKMYPQAADPQRAPFSPGQMENYQETIEEFAKSGKEKRRGLFRVDIFAKDVHTQKSLMKQYNTWKVNIGYGAMTSSQQGQVDNEWDAWVADKKMKWNPQSKEVLAARGKGPLTRGYGSQFRGTPTGPKEAINPLQTSIALSLPKQPKPKEEPQPRIYARNPKTKKRIYSDDGGGTWQTE